MMNARHITGMGMVLALLLLGVLLAARPLVSEHRAPLLRKCRKRFADEAPLPSPGPSPPDLGLRLARWLGAVCCRLWREFYYWTIGEDE